MIQFKILVAVSSLLLTFSSFAQTSVMKTPTVLFAKEKCAQVFKIAVLKDQNMVATAACDTGRNYVLFLLKFTPNGSLLFKVPIGATSHDLVVDDSNNIYFISSGTSADYAAGKLPSYVNKYNSAGKLQWTYKLAAQESDAQNDGYELKSLAVDQNGIYATGFHTKSTRVDIGNGISQTTGSTQVVLLKLAFDGSLLWRVDEEAIVNNNSTLVPDYEWAPFVSYVMVTHFPLSIVVKNDVLYSQHGALRKMRATDSGKIINKTSSPYIYGKLLIGNDNVIRSLGATYRVSEIYYEGRNIFSFADDMSMTGNLLVNIRGDAYSSHGLPNNVAFDIDGTLYVASRRCFVVTEGCGVYTTRMKIQGDAMSAVASPVWESFYGNKQYAGSEPFTLVLNGNSVYVGAQIHYDNRYSKGVLKFAK